MLTPLPKKCWFEKQKCNPKFCSLNLESSERLEPHAAWCILCTAGKNNLQRWSCLAVQVEVEYNEDEILKIAQMAYSHCEYFTDTKIVNSVLCNITG